MKFNGSMTMHSKIVVVACDMNFNYVQPFSERVTKIIEDKQH